MIRYAAALLLSLIATAAEAHPHVFVAARAEILYSADRGVTGVRHSWAFDDMFSSFATQGLDKDGDGAFSREELAPLAKVNVESLKDFDYFTFVKIGGEKQLMQPPVDYWLEFTNQILTLHFTLPLNAPQPLGARTLAIEIYDPSYYVAFDLAEGEPVNLVQAPQGCALSIHRASEPTPELAAKLQIDDFALSQQDLGAQFANRLIVNCP
jgi:ABC-type uncharacterized transport system substrate-binding protein